MGASVVLALFSVFVNDLMTRWSMPSACLHTTQNWEEWLIYRVVMLLF